MLVFYQNIDVLMQSEFLVIWTFKKANLFFSLWSFANLILWCIELKVRKTRSMLLESLKVRNNLST